jgi:hypothetical protein
MTPKPLPVAAPRLSALRRKLFGRSLALFAAAAAWSALGIEAHAQLRAEMRDPVRGVSFHSLEISNDAIDMLDVIDGAFAATDRLSVGVSAMVFDGTGEIDSWIFWVRHEGRRWLDYDRDMPIELLVDGSALDLEPLRSPQPFVGEGGLRYEKLEFELSDAAFERLLVAQSVVVALRTDNGDVDKHFTGDESERLRAFVESIGERMGLALRRTDYGRV